MLKKPGGRCAVSAGPLSRGNKLTARNRCCRRRRRQRQASRLRSPDFGKDALQATAGPNQICWRTVGDAVSVPSEANASLQIMKSLRVGVVGVGHIGSNHARLYADLPNVEFNAIYDVDTSRANAIGKKYGVVPAQSLDHFAEMVDAASIATPTSTHYQIALPLLSQENIYWSKSQSLKIRRTRAS